MDSVDPDQIPQNTVYDQALFAKHTEIFQTYQQSVGWTFKILGQVWKADKVSQYL